MSWAPTHTFSVGEALTSNNMNLIQANLNAIAPSPATTLPVSPADNDRAILVDSVSNPSYTWLFRYNGSSSSSYKWEFIGGAPLIVATTSTTLPAHAGDYYVSGKGSIGDGGTASPGNLSFRLQVAGSTVDTAYGSAGTSGSDRYNSGTYWCGTRVNGAASGASVTLPDATYSYAIYITPIRIS